MFSIYYVIYLLSFIPLPSLSKDVSDNRAIKSELCSPDRPDVELLPGLPQRPASKLATHSHPVAVRLESESDTGGETYETPAGMILPGASKSLAAQVTANIKPEGTYISWL